MKARAEVELILQPPDGEVMPLLVVNTGGFTCPPFSFVAILRGPEGYIRPVKFESTIDMKPGDKFRFDLRLRENEQLTVKFDRNVELFFKDEPAENNMIIFPKS